MKPKVLLITGRADFGGGPEHIRQILKNLHKEFTFYVACPDEDPYASHFRKYATIFIIPHRKLSLIKLWQMRGFVLKENIVVIHSHGKAAGVYARLLRLMTSAQVIHTFHGFHYRGNKSIKGKIMLVFERFLFGLTDVAVNVSRSEQNECKLVGVYSDKKSIIVCNGVDTSDLPKDCCQTQLFRVVNISRLSEEKGVDLVLLVFSNFQQRVKSAHLTIAGDGRSVGHWSYRLNRCTSRNVLILLAFNKISPRFCKGLMFF